jgi:hypothetical protein
VSENVRTIRLPIAAVLGRQRPDDRDVGQPCFLGDFPQHCRREIFVGVHSSGWDLSSGFGDVDVLEDQELRLWSRADDVSGDTDSRWTAKREPPASAMTEDQYIGGLSASTRAGYSTLLFGPATYGLKVTLPEGVVSTIRSGGCRAKAVDQLYGSVARYAFAFEGASLLTLHFIDQIKASEPFKASLRNWSACMRADGDDYADPNAAYNSLAARYDAQGPVAGLRQRELRVATDDLTCTRQVKLLKTIQALQGRPTRWLTKLELGQLLTITQIDQAALTRAVSVG